MAVKKRPKPGICTHCLRYSTNMTWDHVIPRSWYPDTQTSNLPKWKVPACFECNNRLSIVEKELLIRIGICLSPDDPNTASIHQKALRSVLPKFANSKREHRHRAEKLRQLVSQFVSGESLRHTYPDFGLHDGIPPADQHAITFPKGTLETVGEKMVRGIVFCEHQRLLPRDAYEISIHVLERDNFEKIFETMAAHALEHTFGPGLSMKRALAPEDPGTGIYGFCIWEKWRFYASILPKGSQLAALNAQLATSAVTQRTGRNLN